MQCNWGIHVPNRMKQHHTCRRQAPYLGPVLIPDSRCCISLITIKLIIYSIFRDSVMTFVPYLRTQSLTLSSAVFSSKSYECSVHLVCLLGAFPEMWRLGRQDTVRYLLYHKHEVLENGLREHNHSITLTVPRLPWLLRRYLSIFLGV